jgi:flagellar protein FliO/FliZ
MLPSPGAWVGSWLLAAGALAAVLVLIWLAQRAARFGGIGRFRAGARLAVQESIALDTRRRLLLVQCDDRCVLLLTGGAQDVVVGWLPKKE